MQILFFKYYIFFNDIMQQIYIFIRFLLWNIYILLFLYLYLYLLVLFVFTKIYQFHELIYIDQLLRNKKK